MEINDEAICGNAYFTNLAGELTNLICDLPPDHDGDHTDHRHGAPITWELLGQDATATDAPVKDDAAQA